MLDETVVEFVVGTEMSLQYGDIKNALVKIPEGFNIFDCCFLRKIG